MRRYYGIEFLRLLTSLSVLLYHYRLFFNPYNPYSTYNFSEEKVNLPFYSILEIFYIYGIYGVHVFYTISGFVFAYVYLSHNNKVSVKEFFVNRFARLYPLHFATLIIVTLLLFANWIINNSFQINPFHYNDIYHFILQIFFISSWGFENGHSFNSPIWSVSVEIGIYGLFFLLMEYLKKFKLWLTILLILILLIVNKTGLNDSLFLECARLFFSGVLVYYIILKVKFNNLLFLIPITLLILSFVGNYKTYLFCPSLLLFFVFLEEKIKKNNIKNFFGMSGNLTYAIYLLHFPAILMIIIFQEKFSLPEIMYLNTYFFFIFIIILLIAAHFCFKLYEKPLNKKIRTNFLK
tara:strand:- start:102 stop:1151 length:1050 start_codon:yes stop_codon:yes gene_type:complete